MIVGPFDTEPVIERLRTQTTTLRRIAGAAERTTAATDAGLQTPAGYVLLAREDPLPHKGGAGVYRQTVRATFIVLLAIKNVRLSDLGMQGNETLQAAITDVRSALIGWQPTSESTACELAGAELQAYDQGVIWWVEAFQTNYWLTK